MLHWRFSTLLIPVVFGNLIGYHWLGWIALGSVVSLLQCLLGATMIACALPLSRLGPVSAPTQRRRHLCLCHDSSYSLTNSNPRALAYQPMKDHARACADCSFARSWIGPLLVAVPVRLPARLVCCRE